MEEKGITPQFLSDLRLSILTSFNLSEIQTLCVDLGVDYESLGGEGREAKARELIAYFSRLGRLSDLIEYCVTTRPRCSWPLVNRSVPPAEPTTGDRQPQSEVAVSLVFSEAGLVINDEQELKASLAEALFAAENQLPIIFNVAFEPLEIVKRYIKSIENGETSPENRITKVKLQRQAKALETKHKVVNLALTLFFLPPLQYHFISVDELIKSLHGLARLSFNFQCDETTSSLSLAVFRKNDPKLSTVIWIDETEQEQIKTHSGSGDLFVTLLGCDLFDLPRETRFEKAIPAIVLTVTFETIRANHGIHNLFDLPKVLDLYSWSVGLH